MKTRSRFWSRLRSLVRRLQEVEPGRLGLLLHTFALLLTARVALRVVPVQRIIAWKQRQVPAAAVGSEADAVQAVRWAVLVASRYSPVQFVCFPQCLAASELLRRRGLGSRLHYGAARKENELVTHTWLEAAGTTVIGGEVASAFSTLAVY